MLIKQDFPLSEIFYYRLTNTAKFVLDVSCKEDLVEAINFIKQKGFFDQKKFVIAGSGSNLIFTDEYYDGAVIHVLPQRDHVRGIYVDRSDKSIVRAFAGEQMDALIQFAFEKNLRGLEWAGGLPGSIGGAVRGNAGAFGEEIKDSLFRALVLDISGQEIKEQILENNDLGFGYRQSLIKSRKDMIVVEADFKLEKADNDELIRSREIYKKHIEFRRKNHPMEYPSCGSVFKNISEQKNVERIRSVWPDVNDLIISKWHGKVPIGYINKRLKISGLRYGEMQVSEKHANFIVNLGGGKSGDVIKIINEIKSRIHSEFGFIPETEVEIIWF